MELLTYGYTVYFWNKSGGGLNVFLLKEGNKLYAEFKCGKRKLLRRIYEKGNLSYFRYNLCVFKKYY